MPSYVRPSSQTLILKEKKLISVETSETIYQSTRRNIPDDLSLQVKITITEHQETFQFGERPDSRGW
jgi:hypothetical protein